MAEASTALKKAQQITEELTAATKRRTNTTTQTQTTTQTNTDDKFSDIETNTFYKIIFNEKLDPMQKKEAATQALTFAADSTKEENATRLKEFTEFKKYLMNERKRVAQEIIKMTDTGAFSELQGVIEELNSGLLEFDNRMTPLTEIIDAVYKLRLEGGDTVLGVFKEIKEDQAAEEQRKKDLAATEKKLGDLQTQITSTNGDLSVLKNSKSGQYRKFFGLGGLKDDTIRQISEKEAQLASVNATVTDTATELEKLKDPNTARATEYAQFAEQKSKLRELLDLTSEEHKTRQKELVGAAQDFVNKSDSRVGAVLDHLEQMSGQIENLHNVNTGMQSIYAIVTEASKDASAGNQKLRDTYQPPEGEAAKTESPISQMQRESKKQAVEEYITNLDSSTVDTFKTYSDLTSQAVRIKQMGDANRDQVAKTAELHSSGIAGVADRLSTVLQAVSAAALNESTEAARQSISTMTDKTNAVAMKESIRTAMGIKEAAVGLNKAVDDLAAYGEVLRTSSQIAKEGMAEVKSGLANVEGIIKQTRKDLQDAYAAPADVSGSAVTTPANQDEKKVEAPKPGEKKNPFAQFGS